jgi:hypothetical protein
MNNFLNLPTDNIISYGFYLRNIIARNFFTIPYAIQYNNNLYWINGPLYLLVKTLPFDIWRLITQWFQVPIIYKIDDLYSLTWVKSNYIIPLIMEFDLLGKDDQIIRLKSKIKYYNGNIPLIFIIKNNNITHDYTQIRIKYISKGIIKYKIITINDNLDKPLIKLFD